MNQSENFTELGDLRSNLPDLPLVGAVARSHEDVSEQFEALELNETEKNDGPNLDSDKGVDKTLSDTEEDERTDEVGELTREAPRDRFKDDYTLLSILGIGGQATVYKAEEKNPSKTGRRKRYALKRILSRTEFEEESALREVDVLILLPKHENIVQYFDQWDQESDFVAENDHLQTQKREFPEWERDLDETFEQRCGTDDDDFSDSYQSDSNRSDSVDRGKDNSNSSLSIEFEAAAEDSNRSDSVDRDNNNSNMSIEFEAATEDPKWKVKHILMELCSDKTLADYIKEIHELDEGEKRLVVQKIIRQIAMALGHVHQEGWMHRDVKPNNIFFGLNDNCVVKLGDFGLSREIDGGGEEMCMTRSVGTRRYRGPEQGATAQSTASQYKIPAYDEKCDIFSLGMVLFDLLVKCPAYGMEQQKVLDDLKKGHLPVDVQAKYPEEVKLLLKMIQTDPKERPSAKDVVEELKKMDLNMAAAED